MPLLVLGMQGRTPPPQECSYQEIAAIMGCPVNTVKTRMWHARQYLTQALAGLRLAAPPAPQPDLPPTPDQQP
jgi:Sigma-70, region 4